MRRYFLMAFCLCVSNLSSATWNLDANANWNVNGNWTLPAIFPNGIDAIADFGTIITNNRTVTLGQNLTVGTVIFNDNNNYLVTGANTLTFDVSVGNGILTVNNGGGNGAHTLSCPISLNDSLTITQNSTNAAGFTLSGAISGSGPITYVGPQRINFSIANSYTGAANLNNGVIFYNASGSFPSGSTVNVGDGMGAANTTQLTINAGIATPAAFLANVNSDGRLIQGNNRIVRLTGLQGSGEVLLNTPVVQLFEVLGGAGNTTFSGTILGGAAGGTFNGGSRINKTGSSKLTLTGNTSSYTSRTFIGSASVINVQANNALGVTGAGTLSGVFVLSGGALEIEGVGLNLDKYIGLNGDGIGSSGALRNISGINTIPNIVQIGWVDPLPISASDASIGVDLGSLNLSGTVVGTRALTKVGTGTLVFSGAAANTYSGNTTINGGILQLNKTGVNAIISPLILINPTGILQLNQNNQISNLSNLTIDGGTFNMNGFSEELQNLTFNSGSLLQAGGQLTLNGATTPLTMRDVSITGNLLFTGVTGNIIFDSTNNGTGVISGNINLGGVVRAFDIGDGTAPIDLIISGTISNGGVTKNNLGTLELSGSNTYTGATNVNSGSFLINGSLADGTVTVNAPGFLGGTGVIGIGAAMLINNGTVSPATQNTIGTLTLNGSYLQGASGELIMNILSASNHDLLLVNTGSVSLSGNLTVDFLPGYVLQRGDTITLINNTGGGGVAGIFSSITTNNLAPDITVKPNYTPNTFFLSFDFPKTGDVQVAASAAQSAFFLSNQRHLILDRRFDRLRRVGRTWQIEESDSALQDLASSLSRIEDRLTASLSSPSIHSESKCSKPRRAEWYTSPIGSLGNLANQKDQLGFKYWSGGIGSGLDYAFNRQALGIFGAYERASAEGYSNWGDFDIDEFSVEIYGLSYLKSELFVQGIIGCAWDWYKTRRNTSSASLNGAVQGYSFDGLVGIGYDFRLRNISITPEIGAQYLFAEIDKYRENGDENFAVSYRSQSLNALETLLSLRIAGVWGGAVRWIPQIRASWQYQCLDTKSDLVFAPLGFDQISRLQILGPNRNTFVAGAAVRCESTAWSGEFIYDVQVGDGILAHYGYLGLGLQF
ncbi:MAG: autotransporter domain-containing protein [Parachlamydiales bacterium]|nr:autotransporter domain-containing protein [Parachlamydiales bacterium]